MGMMITRFGGPAGEGSSQNRAGFSATRECRCKDHRGVCPVPAGVRIPRVRACACLWTLVFLPCGCSWSASMRALGRGDHSLSGPQLSLCPLPFLAPEEAEKQILPSEGRLKLKTRGFRGPPPVFPSPQSLHLIFRRPIACQLVIQRGFPEPPPGTSTMAQAMCRQQRKK